MRSLLSNDMTVAGSAASVPVRPRGGSRDVVPAAVAESDALLCQLAWLRHGLLLPLAGVAASLTSHSAWLACGCSNVEDFCREGFQRTSRWLRNLVLLHAATARFPALGAAVSGADGGWPLGQMAALAIARVATVSDVERWIERARVHGLESLRQAVGAVLQERGEALEDTPEEEPYVERRVLYRLEVPPEVALAHEALRDLHRAVAGGETGTRGFAEALIGEVSSSGVVPPEDYRPRFVPLAAPSRAVSGRAAPSRAIGWPSEVRRRNERGAGAARSSWARGRGQG